MDFPPDTEDVPEENDGEEDAAGSDDLEAAEDEQPDDSTWDDHEVQEILSITARKLAGVMQARKYGNPTSGPPKRSISDRKKNTHCSACGQQGHWAGDAECTVSNKGGKQGKDASKGAGKGDKGKSTRTVHFMNHYGGSIDERDDGCESQHVSHAVFVSHHLPQHQVCLMDAAKAVGHVIIDTACQRLCAGRYWSEAQRSLMSSWNIAPAEFSSSEYFEFGKGPPIHSTTTFCFPVVFGDYICILAPCILEALIPCLASSHNHIKRSGNRHGSYAQCLDCKIKWRWNKELDGWEHFTAASSSSPLPLPSSATVLDHSWAPASKRQATRTISSHFLRLPVRRQRRHLRGGLL